jgi:hypothetical protein
MNLPDAPLSSATPRRRRSTAIRVHFAQWIWLCILVLATPLIACVMAQSLTPPHKPREDMAPLLAVLTVATGNMIAAQFGCMGAFALPGLFHVSDARIQRVRALLGLGILLSFAALVTLAIVPRLRNGSMNDVFAAALVYLMASLWTLGLGFALCGIGVDRFVTKWWVACIFLLPSRSWWWARADSLCWDALDPCAQVLANRRASDSRRILAAEMIGLRPWIHGGIDALLFVCTRPGDSTAVAESAGVILAELEHKGVFWRDRVRGTLSVSAAHGLASFKVSASA